MADTTYRAAIVGLGFIGGADQVSGDVLGQQVTDLDGTHAEALSKHPRIELVAGSSRDAGRRERFAQRTGCQTYSDWAEMLEKEQLDIVSVATYTPVHAEIAIACAERGVRAIWCEKPVSNFLPDAERMLAACEKAGSLLAINHNRRYSANFRRLRDLVAADGLGDLTSVTLQWGSGRLGCVGTHMIDATHLVVGRNIEAVSGVLDLAGKPDCRGAQFHDPGGWGLMRFEGGLIATVDAADYGKVPAKISLNGSEARATIGRGDVTIEYWDGREEYWPPSSKEMTSMDVAAAEIVAWLDDGTPFPYPAVDAVHTLEVILAFHASHARDATWTPLPLAGADRERELQSG